MSARKTKADPIFSMIARYHSLGRKLNGVSDKRDEIAAHYPDRWFDCASVVVSMFTPRRRQPEGTDLRPLSRRDRNQQAARLGGVHRDYAHGPRSGMDRTVQRSVARSA